MAHKLVLSVPYNGMPFIWNVTAPVGTQNTETNAPTDVRLAKLLFHMAFELPGSGAAAWPTLRQPPTVNETMDFALGFWIYYSQVEWKFKADGVISPGPKFPSREFLISRLNYMLFHSARQKWEALPSHPLCGTMLAAELAVSK